MDYIYSFLFGGLLCLIGQILISETKLTPARILTGYVVSGAVLYAVGLYEPFSNIAKSGATVPLTGFGASLARGVEEAIEKDGAIGILTGGFTATSAGIAAAVVFGLCAALIFRPKRKK